MSSPAASGSPTRVFWCFEPATPSTKKQTVSVTAESKALSRALKEKDWKFVGPTTAYAFMQAMGPVSNCVIRCTCGSGKKAISTLLKAEPIKYHYPVPRRACAIIQLLPRNHPRLARQSI